MPIASRSDVTSCIGGLRFTSNYDEANTRSDEKAAGRMVNMGLNSGDAKIAFAILIGSISIFQVAQHDFATTTIHAATRNGTSDWPAYGGQVAGDHYSALKQINRNNVRQLKVAWKFDTGEVGGLQTNPLVIDGTMYLYSPSQKIFALNAATGKTIWSFDAGVSGQQPNRGMCYWTDGKESRLLASVMDHLYAINPQTGKLILSFGETEQSIFARISVRRIKPRHLP